MPKFEKRKRGWANELSSWSAPASRSEAAKEFPEYGRDIARAVYNKQNQDAVFQGTINHHVVSDRETPNLATEVGTRAAHLRLSRIEAAFLIDPFQ